MEKSLFTEYSEKILRIWKKIPYFIRKRKRGLTMGDRAVISNNAKT